MAARWTTTRLGLSALGAAALIAVVASWLVFASEPRAGSPSRVHQAHGPSTTVEHALADLSPLPAHELESAAPIAVESTRAAVEERPSADGDASPRVFLRGKIESDRTDLELARVEVRGANIRPSGDAKWHPIPEGESSRNSCSVAKSGEFELEVTELALHTSTLLVTGVHPSLLTVRANVSTRPLINAKPRERVELSVELAMTQGGCSVRGRVASTPESALTAQVAVFALQGDPPLPAEVPAMLTQTRDGKFELELKSGDDYVLVAFAERWRPATVSLARMQDGGVLDVGVLQLERGDKVAGQVLLGSAPFGAGLMVIGQVEQPDTVVSIGRFTFAWIGRAFEWTRLTTMSNDLGMYELAALGRCSYSLSLPGGPGVCLHGLEPLPVFPPAQDADIAPSVCEVRLMLLDDGESPKRVTHFSLREKGADGLHLSGYSSDANGHATLWLAPYRAVELVLDSDGTGRGNPIYAGAAGDTLELRIDL